MEHNEDALLDFLSSRFNKFSAAYRSQFSQRQAQTNQAAQVSAHSSRIQRRFLVSLIVGVPQAHSSTG
jgi:hypothetical protein